LFGLTHGLGWVVKDRSLKETMRIFFPIRFLHLIKLFESIDHCLFRALHAHAFCGAGEVLSLNIDVPSHKKLLVKNALNDLSSSRTADKSVYQI